MLKNLLRILLVAGLAVPVCGQGRLASVEKVSVLSQDPLQLQIQTSRPSAPQVQMVTNPDRLVIDIPNSVPGAQLRALAVRRPDIRGVRFSQYSTKPSVTRVVVDLNSPEWYRITPNASGLVVSFGSSESANAQPAIGWVSARGASVRTAPVVLARTAPVVLRKAVATHSVSANGATVQFANGQLTIHANNATLSEVLFQIQKITGAEIAIPSGTEQDRVAADFGPGTASEVMGELLNGTGLNFVVVGSTSDPNQLRSVILSRETGGADPPSAFATVSQPQASAPVIEPDNPELSGPPPENAPQQPQTNNGPPPEGVPN
jgi:hypothetical protein